jgi:hypothetical protein
LNLDYLIIYTVSYTNALGTFCWQYTIKQILHTNNQMLQFEMNKLAILIDINFALCSIKYLAWLKCIFNANGCH